MYDKIIVDVSSFYYRVATALDFKKSHLPHQALVGNAIAFVKRVFLEDWNGAYKKLILCFDPIVQSQLAQYTVNSVDSVKQTKLTLRKKMLASYKKSRVNEEDNDDGKLKLNVTKEDEEPQIKVDVITEIYKEFIQNKYKDTVEVYHNLVYEADDYVECLTRNGKCLLVTTDMDWARYLSRDVAILTSGFKIDNLFTKQSFYDKYKYYPTVVSVALMKAFFGDKSDDIVGSLMLPKIKIFRSIANEIKAAILTYTDDSVTMYDAKLDILNEKNCFTEPLAHLKESLTQKGYDTIIQTTLVNLDVIDSLIYNDKELAECRVLLNINYNDINAIQTSKKIVFNTF